MKPDARPDARTASGVTVWRVLPGRELGQRTGLKHLTWAGQGDAVHLHDGGGTAEDGTEYVGRDTGTVSGRCGTEEEARQGVYIYLATLDQEPPPWLGETLRAAGDISPATATEIRRAAEYGYHTHGSHGEAWAEWAARNFAKGVLAGIAIENDPAVQAALRASREAREHADVLFAAAVGPDGTADLDTPEGMAFYFADHEADQVHEEYDGAHGAAYERLSAEVSQAWREADIDFLRSHRADLKAADPEAFDGILRQFPEASAVLRGGGSAVGQGGPYEGDAPGSVGLSPSAGFPLGVQPGASAGRAGTHAEIAVRCDGRGQSREAAMTGPDDTRPGPRYRELQDFPATDQAIRAGQTGNGQ